MDEDIRKRKEKIAVVGLGKVGTSLAKLATEAGYHFLGGFSRNKIKAIEALNFIRAGRFLEIKECLEADIIFITVPDRSIERVAKEIANMKNHLSSKIFAHCSGLLSSGVLNELKKKGGIIGSFHIMFPFVNPEFSIKYLKGSYVAIEGDATERLFKFALDLSLKPFKIAPSRKEHHHLACVLSSGMLLSLLSYTKELIEECSSSFNAYLTLAEKALKAAEEYPLSEAITGPWKRGDDETIKHHLAIFNHPELYKLLLERIRKLLKHEG